jgi:hypothetical protein
MQSERQIPITYPNNDKLHTFNLYSISARGEVDKSSISRLGWVLEAYGKAIPNVSTSNQISCSYPRYEGREYAYNPQRNEYKTTNLAFDDFGVNVNVSEDKDGIYWKDAQ